MDPNILLLLVLVVLLVWMFFSSRRRQQKMREEQARKAELLVPGARVMTRSGLFGSLVEYDTDDLSKPARVEIAPGVVVELHTQAVDLAPETATDADADDVADDETVEETDELAAPETDATTDESAPAAERGAPEHTLPDLDLGDDTRDDKRDKSA